MLKSISEKSTKRWSLINWFISVILKVIVPLTATGTEKSVNLGSNTSKYGTTTFCWIICAKLIKYTSAGNCVPPP